tara:strand:+ start:312 stop:446 length:135 start_codon:yes stop_codon:yes gene_type:complete
MDTADNNTQEILHQVTAIKGDDWNQVGQTQSYIPPDEPKQEGDD